MALGGPSVAPSLLNRTELHLRSALGPAVFPPQPFQAASPHCLQGLPPSSFEPAVTSPELPPPTCHFLPLRGRACATWCPSSARLSLEEAPGRFSFQVPPTRHEFVPGLGPHFRMSPRQRPLIQVPPDPGCWR